MSTRQFLACGLAAAVAALAGCGREVAEKAVPVRGQLLKGGQPFIPQQAAGKPLPPGDPGMRIRMVSVGGANAGVEYPVRVDPTAGTFEATGATGKGVPPGKYDLIVHLGAFTEAPPPAANKGVGMMSKSGQMGGSLPPPGPKSGPPSTHGPESAKKTIDVPETGLTDVTIELDAKK